MKFTKDQLLEYLQKYLKKSEKIVFKSYYFNIYKNVIRDHPLVYKARIASDYREGEPVSVDPKSLRPTQSTLDVKNLIGLLQGRSIPEGDAIAVAKVGGKLYIINGHHRVWIAVNLGESSVNAYMYDIDAYDKAINKNVDSAPSAVPPTNTKLNSIEDIVEYGKSLINNGVYQIDVHDKYDSSFWSKWGRDEIVMQYLTGKIHGDIGVIDPSRALSLEDRSINVSHLIKVASGTITVPVVAFKKKNQYWVIEGFTQVFIAQKLRQSKIPALIIDLGK